ncbi:MAG: GNAT family N-acetyltransferase [Alicyclobacillus sp.]|nr:GNAT family N-acetyltransferase [Alicyclobacillus sp.]
MIRIAKPDEARLVHEVMLAAFEEYRYIDVPSSALNETVASIEQSLGSGAEQALLYVQDGAAVGSCRFKRDRHALYFSRLSVRPEARGRGIAKAMLKWLENHARDHGLLEMWCRVRMSVPRNIELYKSLGFIVTQQEVVTNANGFPVQTVVMRKQVIPAGGYPFCAAAAVCVQNDRLLMVLQGREDEEKTWSVPSGVKDVDESYEACCVREVLEETGYVAVVKRVIHAKSDGAVRYFEVDLVGGETKIQDPDNLIYEIAWKSREDIQQLRLTYEEDRAFLLGCLA